MSNIAVMAMVNTDMTNKVTALLSVSGATSNMCECAGSRKEALNLQHVNASPLLLLLH